jgi:hypothetical protein
VENFYSVFSELLKERYLTVKSIFLEGDYLISDKNAKEWAPKIDTFVYGVGD